MKEARFLQILVVAWILTNTATANDDMATESPVSQPQSARTETGDRESGNRPPILDRRDRIFYPGDTERAKPLLRKLFLNIVLDQEEIFTSPLHINRHNEWEWLLPTAATGGLIAADHHIADAFENSRGQVRWGGRVSNIGASYTLIPIVAGSYVYGAWRDNAKAREIGVLGTESLLDSLIVGGILKEVFMRSRPDEKQSGDFWGGGGSSSGRSSTDRRLSMHPSGVGGRHARYELAGTIQGRAF